jgi:hypothetical protein
MDPSTKTEYPQDSSCFRSVSESRLGIISDSVAATQIYAKVDLVGLREVAALDVRPLVACIEQCEQIAAPFYRIGEIRALRDVGNLGLGGVA